MFCVGVTLGYKVLLAVSLCSQLSLSLLVATRRPFCEHNFIIPKLIHCSHCSWFAAAGWSHLQHGFKNVLYLLVISTKICVWPRFKNTEIGLKVKCYRDIYIIVAMNFRNVPHHWKFNLSAQDIVITTLPHIRNSTPLLLANIYVLGLQPESSK